MVGGTLRESAVVLVPQSFRNAKTYQVFIGQMLDFMAEDMAGVDPEHRPSPPRVDNFVARKTVGNFVDLATLATFHVSPMLLLALVGDIAYGSKAYLKELAEDLEARGVIEDASAIQQADDLLEAVASASQKTAQSLDTPPLSVEGLKETIRQTRESVAEIDPSVVLPKEDLDRLWERIRSTAKGEGVSPLAISGLIDTRDAGEARQGRHWVVVHRPCRQVPDKPPCPRSLPERAQRHQPRRILRLPVDGRPAIRERIVAELLHRTHYPHRGVHRHWRRRTNAARRRPLGGPYPQPTHTLDVIQARERHLLASTLLSQLRQMAHTDQAVLRPRFRRPGLKSVMRDQ